MDSITRSPIVEHLSATLQGLHIIRAFQAVDRFERIEVQRINNNHRFLFAFEMASRWLAYRLDVMSTVVVALTGVFIIVLQDQITPSVAGLALSYALQLSQVFQWSGKSVNCADKILSNTRQVRMTAETESLMTSVERLVHYTRTLDSEAPRVIEEKRPPSDWPTQGNITYRGVRF
jgi:ABC-type multidrug transport system fused ATPase/permease subunit